MPKTKISEFSATPANNTDIDSINIAEGCAPSGINDAIRELMAQLKDFQTGAVGDSFNGPVGTTTAAAGAFTTLSSTGNTTLGDASGDSVTINGTATFANANPTLSAGTANGVAYLNGSKVVTSGSAFQFNGKDIGLGGVASPLGGSIPTFYGLGANANNSGGLRLSSSDSSMVISYYANNGLAYFGSETNTPLLFTVNNSEQMRLTSTGLGIGTSSPSNKFVVSASGAQGIEINPNVSGTSEILAYNRSGSAWNPLKIITSNFKVNISGGGDALTLDSSGNLGLGVTPSAWRSEFKVLQLNARTSLFGSADSTFLSTNEYIDSAGQSRYIQTGSATRYRQDDRSHIWSYAASGTAGNAITFTQAMSLDSSGNLLVGTTSGSNHQIKKAVSVGSVVLEVIGNNVGCTFYNGDGGTPNAANAVLKVTSVGATGRSINAAGTINAAGLDYAEYMTKSGDFTVAKGDVVGIDAQGKLTNVFANSVSFVVKSTNPSYVGGDTWGGILNEDALEIARQTVDRIAFAGQVPVNVIGATAGQYIIPVNDNGSIKGQAVSNPTFEQYQSSVGKVIAIESDGRARIIVKVA